MPILNMVWWWKKWGNIWEPLNLTVTTIWLDATIKWEDNEIWTIPPTTFQKSELVRKIGSAPTSPSDWDLVVTETVKDTYKVSGYVDSWLTDWETYYYRVFSYSDLGGISYCDAVNVTPSNQWQPWANTLAYWKFDDNLSDSSGNNNNATYYYWTAISYDTWLVWESAVFWPTILTTPLNTTLFNSEFTLSFCVYITAIASSNVIRLLWWQNWYTAIQYEWWFSWLQRYDNTMGRTGWSWTPSLNTWHHIVITGDGVNPLVCYINGNVATVDNYNYSYSNSSRTLWIGNSEGTGDVANWLQWRFDEFIIENKMWTASDVARYRTYNLWL